MFTLHFAFKGKLVSSAADNHVVACWLTLSDYASICIIVIVLTTHLLHIYSDIAMLKLWCAH